MILIFAGGIGNLQSVVLVDIGGMDKISKITGCFTMAMAISLLIGIPLAGNYYNHYTGRYLIVLLPCLE